MSSYLPTKKEIITAFTISGLSLIVFVFFATLTVINAKSVNQDLKESEEMSRNIQNLLYLKSQVKNLEEKVSVLDSFFVKDGEEPVFIAYLENFAESFGLEAETLSISVKPINDNNMYENLLVSLRFEGKLREVEDFLKAVQNMQYGADLNEVSISLLENGAWSGDLALSAYKLK